MKKADIDARMADYLEGDLPLEDRALFDAHLDADADAAREVDELRRTIDMLRSLPDPEPPADLAGRVMERIRAGEARGTWTERWAQAMGAWLSPQWAVPATAAAALVALAVVSGDIPLWPTASETPVAEVREPTPVTRARTETTAPSRTAVPDPLPPTELAARPTPPAPRAAEPSASRPQVVARADAPPGARVEVVRPPLRAPTGAGAPPAPLVAVANPVGQPPRGEERGLGLQPGPTPLVLESTSGPLTSSAFEEPATPEEAVARRNSKLDPMLDALYANPQALVDFLSTESDGELENWGKELARRAAERGEAERASEAVAAIPSLDIGPFLAAFEGESGRLRRDVIASESEGAAPTGDR